VYTLHPVGKPWFCSFLFIPGGPDSISVYFPFHSKFLRQIDLDYPVAELERNFIALEKIKKWIFQAVVQ